MPPTMPPPPPGRRPWFSPNGFVLTRLHARYGKESLGEDLVFKEAPPITGGREVRVTDDALEHGATPASFNNFQGRYAIRYPWKGEVKCSNPIFGVWGGQEGTPTAAENTGRSARMPVCRTRMYAALTFTLTRSNCQPATPMTWNPAVPAPRPRAASPVGMSAPARTASASGAAS